MSVYGNQATSSDDMGSLSSWLLPRLKSNLRRLRTSIQCRAARPYEGESQRVPLSSLPFRVDWGAPKLPARLHFIELMMLGLQRKLLVQPEALPPIRQGKYPTILPNGFRRTVTGVLAVISARLSFILQASEERSHIPGYPIVACPSRAVKSTAVSHIRNLAFQIIREMCCEAEE